MTGRRATHIRCAWLALALWAAAAQAADSSHQAAPALGLIVQFRDAPAHDRASALSATASASLALRMQHALHAAGLDGTRQRPAGRAAQLLDFGRVLDGSEAQQAAERLRAQPEVEWVVPNERERRLQSAVTPNDLYFGGSDGQWWLQRASGSSANAIENRLRGVPDVQTAWSTDTGAPAVPSALVAVLDSGIVAHADLAGRVLTGGHDFVSEVAYANDGDGRDTDPTDPGDWIESADLSNPLFRGCALQDSSWHGTINAGIVAAAGNNVIGGSGVNWDGRVLPVRVAGKCGATVADIVDGMRWAAGLHVSGVPDNATPARIISISFGGSAACNEAYRSAIDDVTAQGAVVVVAAGNESNAPTRPANCAGVIGVGALNRDGFKASYSNFGSQLVVSTVGGDPTNFGAWGPWLGDDGLLTLINLGAQSAGQDGYGRVAGTSFATPIVAGVVSLMLSTNPDLTAAQIIQGLRLSARPHVTSSVMPVCSDAHPGRCICTTSTCGAGILDAGEALNYALDPAHYLPPNRPQVVIDSPELTAALNSGSADVAPNVAVVPARNSSGSGGGALSWLWLAGLALGVLGVALNAVRSATRRA